MAAIIDTKLDAHRYWPLHGDTKIESYSKCKQLLDNALEKANKQLKDVKVVFLNQLPETPNSEGIDPKRNVLLGIETSTGNEPIDIFDIKALDEQSLKPLNLLTEEIVTKVQQHLTAKKTQGILFSSLGAKFDLRQLKKHTVTIDDKGYLLIDSHRVFVKTQENKIRPLKAQSFHSYTILRFISFQEKIRIIDDYDFARTDQKGMFISTTESITFAKENILPEFQKDDKNYSNGYYALNRDQMTPSLMGNLYEEIKAFPPP